MKIKLPRLKLNNTDALSLQVYAYLRTLIIQNQLPPGTALSENELSAHFDISRQPVRESLARLSREELVEIIPQKGSFVKKISVKNLKEVCFVRVAMECSAVRDAMELDEKSFTGKNSTTHLIRYRCSCKLIEFEMVYEYFPSTNVLEISGKVRNSGA